MSIFCYRKRKNRELTRFARGCALFLILISPMTLWGNPVGPNVVSGSASFNSSGNTLNITTSHQVVINWQDFSIQTGELTQFFQPNSSSLAVNRVVTGNPSAIYGTLRANGNIMLVNPNGVIVGAGGMVDTGGFMASTLDLPDMDYFGDNDALFSGDSTASIQNFGEIRANSGDVILISREVENLGNIEASQGSVAIAAGAEVLLARKDDADQRIFVRPEAGSGSISNEGTIEAMEVEMEAAGGNPYAFAINNGGTVRAVGFDKSGGRVRLLGHEGLVKLAGTIKAGIKDRVDDVVEAVGGIVEVTAPEIYVVEGTNIDASGLLGGGKIFIGGNKRGEGPLPNAQNVVVEGNTSFTADAIQDGDGGEIIVFAENSVRIEGSFSAQGGSDGGDGGFIETSGKVTWYFPNWAESVNLNAANGTGGTFLIDPNDIVIMAGDGADFSETGGTTMDDTIFADDVSIFLASASLIIQTDSGAVGGSGDITMDGTAVITWSTLNDLTITADRDIVLNAGATIAATGGGSVTMNAARAFLMDGNATSAASISALGGGDITIDANSGSATGNFDGVTINGRTGTTSLSTDTGSITITAISGDTAGDGAINLSGASISSTTGTISLSGTANNADASAFGILMNDGGTGLPDTSITATGAGAITLTGTTIEASTAGDEPTISSSGGNITFNTNSYNIEQGTISSTGALVIAPTTTSATIGVSGGAGTLNLTAAEIDVIQDGFASITIGDTAAGTGAVTVNADTFLDSVIFAGGSITAGAITMNDGSVTFQTSNGTGNTVVDSVTGTTGGVSSDVTFDSNTTGTVSVTSNIGTDIGTVTVTNSGGTTFNGTVSAASATLTDTTGTISFAGDLTLTTGLTTAAQGYNVSITGATNSIAGDTTFLNTGTVTLGDAAADSTTFAGGLDTTAASGTNIGGSVATTNTQMDLGAITLTSPGPANLDSGSGAINIASVTDGINVLTLNLQNAGGTGDVTFTGNVDVGTLTTNAQAYAVNLLGGGAITNAVTFNNTGGVQIGDTSADTFNFASGVDTGTNAVRAAGDITTSNDDMTFGAITVVDGQSLDIDTNSGAGNISIASISGSNTTMTGEDVSLISGTGTVTVTGTIGTDIGTLSVQNGTGTASLQGAVTATSLVTDASAYALNMTGGATIANAVTFNNTGGVQLGDATADTFTFNGGLDTGTNAVTAAGTINTTDTGATLGVVSIVDGQSLTVDTGAGAGNITITSITGDNTTMTGEDVTLISGSGTTTVSGAIGTDIGTLTLQENAATSTGAVSLQGNVVANTLTTFGQAYDVLLTGASNTITTDTNFLNTGAVTIGDADTDSNTFTGGLDTTAASGTNIAGSIATTNSQIDLGAVTMTANTNIDSGSGAINAASITDGASNFILDLQNAGGTGNVAVSGAVTINTLTTNAQAYRVSLLGGGTIDTATTFNNTNGVRIGDASGDTFTFTGGVDTGTNAVSAAGTINTTDTGATLGAVNIVDAQTLTIDTGTGAGNITITSIAGSNATMTGEDVTLISGSGTTTVSGAIGTDIGTLTLQENVASSTGAVALQGNVTANTLTTFGQAYDVSLTGASNAITTDTTFQNTGAVTLGDADTDSNTFTGGLDTTAASGTNTAGSIITTNTQIDLDAVTMTANTNIDSGSGAVNIASVTDGASSFTLDLQNAGGTGDVTVNGAVTINALTTNAQAYAVNLTGGGTIATATTFNNTGGVQLGDATADTFTFNGGLDTGTNVVTAAGTINTTNTDATLGTVSIVDGQNLTVDTGTGAGNITITSIAGSNATMTGEDVTLISGSGTTTVSGAIGTDIGTLMLQENAASSTGAVSLQGDVTANTLTTFAQNYAVNLTGGGTITTATTFNNSGGVQLGDATADTFTFNGGLDTGTNAVTAAGTINTTDTGATLGVVSIVDGQSLTVDTGAGAGNITITSITGDNTTMTGEDVTLISGSGTTTVSGAIGTDIGTLTLQENAATSTGAVSLQGNVVANTLTTFGQAYDVSMTGAANVITTDTTFLNTGTVTLGDAATDSNTFTGGLDTTAASGTNTAGSIITTNTQIDLGAVTMTANTNIDSGSGAVNIASVTDGTSSFTLDLQNAGGTGDVTISGAITINALTTNAQAYAVNLTGGGTITTATTFNNTGGVQLGDASADIFTFTGGVDTGTNAVTAAGTINTTDTDATFGAIGLVDGQSLTVDTGTGAGNITVASITGSNATMTGEDVTLISGSGTTTVSGAIGTDIGTLILQENAATSTGAVSLQGDVTANTLTIFAQNYAVNLTGGATITNAVTFNNTGGVQLGDASADTFTFTGGVDTGTNAVTAAGTINTTDTDATFGAIGLVDGQSLTVDTGTGAGNIAITSITGSNTTMTGEDVTLISGSGTTTVSGAIGTDIGTLTLQENAATSTGAVSLQGNVVANTLTTFGQAYDVSMTGAANVITADTTFLNTGTVTLGDADTDSNTFTGGLDTTAASGTNTAGSIITTNTQIDLGAVTMTANINIDSGSGAVNIASVTDGASSFTLDLQNAGGTGDVTVNGAVTIDTLTTNAQAYAVNLTGGGTITTATTFNNNGGVQLGDATADTFNFTGGLDTGTNAVTAAGTINTTNTNATLGAVSIVDGQNLTVDTGTGAGNIAITSITGSNTTMTGEDVTLISGSGTTTVSGAIGTDIGTLTLQENAATSTGAVSLQGNVTANTLTTFGQAYAVSFTGASNTITSDTNFLNTGTVTLGDDAGDSTTFAGGLATTGNASNPSSVNLAGTITTTNTQIDLGAVTLTAATTLDSGATGADINLGQITGGTNALVLDGGTAGNITATNAANVMGNLSVTAASASITENDAITQGTTATDAWNVTGITTLNASGNAITLENSTNNFGGTINVSGAAVSLRDTNALTLGTVTASDLTLHAGGAISVPNILNISGLLTITDSAGATFSNNVITDGVTIIDTTGTVEFQANLISTSAFTAQNQAFAVNLLGTTNTIASGTFNNTGGLQLGNANGDTNTFTGGLNTGTNAVAAVGTINTTNADATLGAITIQDSGSLTIDTGTGAGNLTIASITGDNTTMTGENVTLVSGAGTTTVTGAIGTDIGTLRLQENAASSTGAVSLQGNVTADTLTTFGQAYDVSLTGASNAITTDTNFLNTGTLTLGDAASDSITFTGGLATTGNVTNPTTVNLAGTVTTSNAQIDLGAVTLTAATTIDSGATGANINLGQITGGTNALVLDAGTTGTITASNGANVMGNLTVTAANASITENADITQGGAWTVGGTTTLNAGTNDITLTNTGNNFGTVELTANAASIDDTNGVNIGASTITNALDVDAAGAVGFTGTVGAGSLNVDTNVNGGTGGTITQTGALTVTGTTVLDAGDQAITLANAGNDFTGAVSVTGTDVSLRDANGLTMGTTVSTNNLTLQAGGAISVPNALNVGSGGGTLTITNSAGTTFSDTVTADTIVITDTTGTVAFQGNLTVNSALTMTAQGYAVSITGATNTIAGDTSFLNTGAVAIGDATTDTTTFTDGLATAGNATNPSSTSIAGTIQTTNAQIDLGATTVTADATVNSGTAGTQFASTVTAGANNLTITGDEIDFNGGGGSVTGTGDLTLAPGATATTIGIAGGTGTLDISATDIDALADGFNSITIGLAGGTGAIDLETFVALDPVTIAGGASITGPDAGNTYNITNLNEGTISGFGSTLTFQNIEALTGGSGNDTFIFANTGSLSGALDGGGGTGDALTGDNDGNIFTITASNGGTLTGKTSGWSNIETLNGGTDGDTFTFNAGGSLDGSLAAGDGSDTLDLSGRTTGVTVTLASDASVTGLNSFITGTITSIENFGGTSAADNITVNPIITAVTNNTRTIDGNDPTTTPGDTLTYESAGGTVTFSSAIISEAGFGDVSYQEIESLVFNGAGGFSITGTAGSDTLTLSTVSSTALDFAFLGGASGSLTGLGVSTVTWNAGDGSDTLIVDGSSGNVLNAGGIAYNGQTGTSDGLRVTGDATNDIAVYTPDATTMGNGVVSLNGIDITFTGLEPVDITGMTTVTVSPGGAADVLTVTNGFDFFNGGATAALRVSGTTAGTTIETVALYNNTNVIIDTSAVDGNDTVTIASASNAHGNTNFTVTTDAGATTDTINLDGDTTFTGGTVTFNDAVTLGAGVNVTAGTTNFNDTLNGAQALTVTGNGAFNGLVGSTTSLSSINVTGTTNINTGAVNTTGNQTYTGAVTISTGTSLNSGGTVAFGSTVDSATGTNQSLAVNGNASFGGAVGSTDRLSTFAVSGTTAANGGSIRTTSTQTYSNTVTLGAGLALDSGVGAINANAVTDGASSFTLNLQNAGGTGTVTFNGAVTVNTLTTNAQAYGVIFNAGGTIDTDTTFANTGGVTLGNDAADSITFTGGLDTTAGATSAAGTVATTNTQIDIGALTLTAATTINSNATTTAGAINVGQITGGANALTLTAGTTANVTANNASNVMGNLVVSGNDVNIRENDAITSGGAWTVAGTATLNAGTNAITLTNAGNDFATVASTGSNIALTDTNAIILGATTATGTLDVNAGGTITDTAALSVGGIATFNAGANNITLDTAANDFMGAVNVTGGTVTLRDTNALALGTTVSTTNLSLQAGGAISVPNAINVGTGAGTLTIVDSTGTTFGNSVTAGTIVLTDTTGTIAFQVDLTVNTALTTAAQGYAVSITGGTNSIAGDTTFANTGQVTIGDAAADTSTFVGGLDTTGVTGGTSIAGTVQTTNSQIDLGATTLTDTATVDSGTATTNLASTVTAGANDLTISGDEIDFAGGANSVTGTGNLTLAPGSAATTIDVNVTAGAGTLDISSTDLAALQDGFSSITIGDATAGTGAVDVDAVTFTDNINIVGGSIVVTGLNAGTNTAVLTARTGAITDGDGGTAATDVTATSAAFSAATGVGTTANPLETTVSNLAAQTTSSGDIVITNSGGVTVGTVSSIVGLTTSGSDITLVDNGNIVINSNVLARSNGNVSINSTGGSISVNADVMSVAASTGNTGNGSGNITFTADSMALNAGSISASGGGILTVAPQTVSTSIGIGGGMGTLQLDDSEIALFANDFSSIVFGVAAGTGAVDLEGFTALDPVTIAGGSSLTGPDDGNSYNITGADTGTISGFGSTLTFQNIGVVTGGSANDTFTFANAGSLSGALNGGGGTNTLVGDSDGNAFGITGADSGTLTGKTTGWSNIQNLTGGTGNDTFTFGAAGTLSGTVDGSTGTTDTINLSTDVDVVTMTGTGAGSVVDGAAANVINAFTGIESIDGGATGANTLVNGSGAAEVFNVTGADSGTLTNTAVAFSQFANLTGAAAILDTFTFGTAGTISGTIDGGAGSTDLINLSTDVDVVTITGTGAGSVVDGTPANVIGAFTGIESIDGGATGANTLINNTNADAIFNVTAANAGTLTTTAPATLITYSNFGNLTGDDGVADQFVFSNGIGVTGAIDGGTGTDVLDYSAYTTAVTVNLNTGTATNVTGGISNVETVLGGSAGDDLTGSTTVSSTLQGNGGNDTYNVTFSGNAITTTITEAAAGGADTINLTGTTGDDTFTLTAATTISDGNHSVVYDANSEDVNLDGLGQTTADTLVGFNQINTFNITGADAGDLGVIDFTNLESLTGGNLNDTFAFTVAGTISGTVTGGAGTTDAINLSTDVDVVTMTGSGAGSVVDGAAANVINAFTGIESIDGGATGANTLVNGSGSAEVFNVTGADSGTLTNTAVAFSQFANLTGAAAVLDTFTFGTAGTISGTIDGGTGSTDVINLSTDVDVVTITGTGAGSVVDGVAANVINAFTGIESVDGGTTGANTLVNGTGAASIFNVTGANSGTLTTAVPATLITYSSFENLTGANAIVDTFTFGTAGTISGTIDGGTGSTDVINLSTDTDVVTITGTGAGSSTDGAANVINAFTGIETIDGGTTGANTLVNGTGAASIFNITSADGGTLTTTVPATLVTYTSFGGLTGDSLADSFVFGTGSSLSGSINGAGGSDTLDLSALTTGVTITMTSAGAVTGFGSVTGTITNLENFTGTTAADTVTVQALTGSTRTLNGSDPTTTPGDTLIFDAQSGAASFSSTTIGSGANQISFSNFESLNLTNVAGLSTLAGSAGDDNLTLTTVDGDSIQYAFTGGISGQIDGGTSFQFDAGTGSDTVTVDASGGGAMLTNGITYNGGDPTSGTGDGLRVVGDGTDDTAVYTPDATTAGNGTVALNGVDIDFTGLEALDVTAMLTATVSPGGGDDILTVVDGNDFLNGMATNALVVSGTTGGTAIQSVALYDNTNVVIDTSNVDGDDTVNITSASNTSGTTNFTVTTGAPNVGADITNLNGNVSFAGGTVTFNDEVALGTAVNVTGTSVNFNDTIDGGNALTVTGNGVFGGIVGGGTALTSINVTGTSAINTTGITTTGTQTYNGATTLGSNTTLTGGTITFGNTVDGGQTLGITGNAVFNGIVGGTTSVTSIGVSGTTDVNTTAVTTTGTQTYTGATTISSDTTLTGSTVAFGNTVNSDTGMNRALTITGDVSFANTVGVTDRLASFSVSGATAANGGDIRTAGNQSYTGTVTMGANLDLDSGTGTIVTNDVTDGANSFALNLQNNGGTGDVTLNGVVTIDTLTTNAQGYSVALNGDNSEIATDTNFVNTGGVTIGNEASDRIDFLAGLDTTAVTGGTTIAGRVVTDNAQMDLGAVTMTANSVIRTRGAALNVASLTDGGGGFTLTLQNNQVTATGTVTFLGDVTVGDITTFNEGYAVVFNEDVTTTSMVTFNNAAVTFGDATDDIATFQGGVDNDQFGGTVTNVIGTVRTAGNSMIFGATTLNGATTLDTTNNGGSPTGAQIRITGQIAGAGQNLTVNAGTGGSLVATNTNNDVDTLTVTSASNVQFDDANALNVGASTTTTGIFDIDTGGAVAFTGVVNTAGDLNVDTNANGGTGGAITQTSELVVTANAIFDSAAADTTLMNANNQFGTIAVTAANATVNEADATDIAASVVTTNFALTSAGDVTQSGTITAPTFSVMTTGGLVDLSSSNSVTTLDTSSSTGAFTFNAGGALGVNGVTGVGNVELVSVGNFTLNGAVNGGLVILASTGGEFTNGIGGNPLAGAGNYYIYSSTDAGTTLGGIGINFQQFNTTYRTLPPNNLSNNWLLLSEVSTVTTPITVDPPVIAVPEIPTVVFDLPVFSIDDDLEDFLEGFLEEDLGEIDLGIIKIGDGDLNVSEELLAKLKEELNTEAKQDLLGAMRSLLDGGLDIREADLPNGLIYLENSEGKAVVIPIDLLFEALERMFAERERKQLEEAATRL